MNKDVAGGCRFERDHKRFDPCRPCYNYSMTTAEVTGTGTRTEVRTKVRTLKRTRTWLKTHTPNGQGT